MANRTFNHESTTDEVLAGIDLSGKRALVTGGASGLGAETVRALASKGAEVIIAARDMAKANEVKESVAKSTGNDKIDILALELASLKKIEASAKAFLDKYDSLNLLINNAGIMACPFEKTEDGFEMQFGSNHIGHFYFTNLLMPALLKGAPSRIVSLSSLGHRTSPVVFDDIHYKTRDYDKWGSYGQSKTANALFALGLQSRVGDKDVQAFSVHPGVIPTPLARHMTPDDFTRLAAEAQAAAEETSGDNNRGGGMKSVEQGAATSCFAATAPELEGHGGVYLEDCGIAEKLSDSTSKVRYGVRPYAYDAEAAEKLWAVSEEMVRRNFTY